MAEVFGPFDQVYLPEIGRFLTKKVMILRLFIQQEEVSCFQLEISSVSTGTQRHPVVPRPTRKRKTQELCFENFNGKMLFVVAFLEMKR